MLLADRFIDINTIASVPICAQLSSVKTLADLANSIIVSIIEASTGFNQEAGILNIHEDINVVCIDQGIARHAL